MIVSLRCCAGISLSFVYLLSILPPPFVYPRLSCSRSLSYVIFWSSLGEAFCLNQLRFRPLQPRPHPRGSARKLQNQQLYSVGDDGAERVPNENLPSI